MNAISKNSEFATATVPVLPIHGSADRGSWNEILKVQQPDGSILSASNIIGQFKGVLPETFVDFDKKMRGDSLNVDLYGYDSEQGVAVIQIRHASRRYRNGYMNVRKDYVLVGRNETTNKFFRHPISGHAVHAGIRNDESSPAAAVRAAQRWMWDVDDKQLTSGIRQGDVLMVPAKKPSKAEVIDAKTVVVGGTHEVRAFKFMQNAKGVVFALTPTIKHTKDQHEIVFAEEDRWYSIRVGREASTWEWGVRLKD